MTPPKKTHCHRGHPRTPENVQGTTCKVCKAEWQRAKRATLTEAEREAERQARRSKRVTNRTWAEQDRARHRARARERYQTDAEYREAILAKKREAYRARREEVLTTLRERYWTDPEYRARKIAANYRRRERYRNDPKLLELERERWRFAAEKQRRESGAKPRNFTAGRYSSVVAQQERVDREPFLRWLDDWLARDPDRSDSRLCSLAGVTPRVLHRIRHSDWGTTIATVDKFLTAADEPAWLLDDLYPLEEAA